MQKKRLEEIERLHPVYVFYGTETFLMEEALQRIQKKMGLGDHFGNVLTFDLEETPLQHVIGEAEMVSLFGGSRLIIGKNAMFATSSKAKVEHKEKALFSYLERPVTGNVLVFVIPLDKLDKRKKVTKALEQYACTLQFQAPKEKALFLWLLDHIKQYHVTMEGDAANRLIELTGNNIWFLHQECQKMSTYVGQNGIITLSVVEEMVPRTLEQDVFKLMDLLMNREIEDALRVWNDLIFLAQEPLRILALLIRQLRITLRVKLLIERGKSETEIASFLKVHPYPVKLARKQAVFFSECALRSYLLRAIQAEEESKMGLCSKQVTVEKVLFYMCEDHSRM